MIAENSEMTLNKKTLSPHHGRNFIKNIFYFIANHTSYCFALVPFVALGGYFSALYGFFLIYFSIDFSQSETERIFALTIIFMLLLVSIIHSFLFGILGRYKIPAFFKFAHKINLFYFKLKNSQNIEDKELIENFKILIKLPHYHMLISLAIVVLVSFPSALVEFLLSRSTQHLIINGLGAIISGVVYSYLCYIITEYLSSDMRGICRRLISIRSLKYTTLYGLSIKKKIMLNAFFMFFSTAILVYFLVFCSASLFYTILFLIVTFLIMFFLTTVLLNSITSALKKISSATRELSSGAGGLLYFGYNEMELIEFSESFNRSVKEIIDLRHNLQNLVDTRTKDLRKKAEELEEANRSLKELDEIKSGFLSSVSHELRTPLTSIIGFTKLIRKDLKIILPSVTKSEKNSDKKKGRIAGNLDIIIQEGDRLTRLINDVLDLSKIESGRIEWIDTVLSIGECIEHAVRAMSSQLAQKDNVEVGIHISDAAPKVKADRDKLVQVVINLINNALKFTEEGHIRIDASGTSDGMVQVMVSDTGIGVPQEDLEKIFDKFHQVIKGDTLSNKPKGTGLGLSICRHIIEHYGGRIWAESQPTKGCTVKFILPAFPNTTP